MQHRNQAAVPQSLCQCSSPFPVHQCNLGDTSVFCILGTGIWHAPMQHEAATSQTNTATQCCSSASATWCYAFIRSQPSPSSHHQHTYTSRINARGVPFSSTQVTPNAILISVQVNLIYFFMHVGN